MRVGDEARELTGEEALEDVCEEEGVDEGVDVLGGEISDQRKKLAELLGDDVDSANWRFCCSKNRLRSAWKASNRDVRAPPPDPGSKDRREGRFLACGRFWKV